MDEYDKKLNFYVNNFKKELKPFIVELNGGRTIKEKLLKIRS